MSTAQRLRRLALRTLVGLAALLFLVVGALYVESARLLHQRYPVPVSPVSKALESPASDSVITRGQHLARAVMSCTLCHGADLGGHVYGDAGPIGIFAGPNLTRGQGGHGADFGNDDWVRAIRYGNRRDGTSLIVMPSESFVHLGDRDLAALVSYLRTLPPVNRTTPATAIRPLGRALLAAGKLTVLAAPRTARVASVPDVAPSRTAEYGHYIAGVAGCRGCHGVTLSGGKVAGPPGLPPARNLTSDTVTGIGAWTETDFVRAMRLGKRPDGSAINTFMPWEIFRGMTDDELNAIWRYLRSVPPRAFAER